MNVAGRTRTEHPSRSTLRQGFADAGGYATTGRRSRYEVHVHEIGNERTVDESRARSERPPTAPEALPQAESCDWCGSTDLWWRNCKLLCRSCNAIVKSCADL
jgi:hypothetical protein